ncbi:MAG TPA: CHAD domain-containing protein [Gemmatimonadales bacterium]|nr:CHAD domain-containing protein [Gemmatimonadales bacterium]
MTDLPADLLDRQAGEATGLLARHHLADAAAAASRLTARGDAEALHDFRVAVRRLRVTLRAYPALREGVAKKYRRRLRKLVRDTNAARDAEAQVVWFLDRSAQFTPSQRAALGPLRSRLRARRRRARTHTHVKLQRRFAKLERKIRHVLADLPADQRAPALRFRAIAAATLVTYAMDLRKRLEGARLTSAPDLHATRIAAKRLRYLLEPVEKNLAHGTRLLERLKQLQDLIGALTDAHELQGELQRASQTDHQAGVAAAMQLLEAEVSGLLTSVQADWSTAGAEIEQEVTAAARQISPVARQPQPHRPARRASRAPA